MKRINNFKPGQVITLFDASVDSDIRGVLILARGQKDNLFLRKLAFLLLFVSIFGLTTVFFPIGAAEINFRTSHFEPKTTKIESSFPSTPANNRTFLETLPVTGIYEFKITIPKIHIESTVIPNVDASNENLYKSELQKGVAHAKGSYLPGEEGSVFLFSHSTDGPWNVVQYNAQFYALKELSINDEIFIFYNGKKFRYVINETRIVSPFDLTSIRASSADLILSTCWPPGTDWQRLLVFAKS